jgi:hypothetical protein
LSLGVAAGALPLLSLAVPFTFLQTPPALALRRFTAFATGLGCQFAVSRKAARLGRDCATAFASCVGGKRSILCEASFFMRDAGAAFSGNLALFLDIHAGEAAQWGDCTLLHHLKLLRS